MVQERGSTPQSVHAIAEEWGFQNIDTADVAQKMWERYENIKQRRRWQLSITLCLYSQVKVLPQKLLLKCVLELLLHNGSLSSHKSQVSDILMQIRKSPPKRVMPPNMASSGHDFSANKRPKSGGFRFSLCCLILHRISFY